jgi:hypothetical protein
VGPYRYPRRSAGRRIAIALGLSVVVLILVVAAYSINLSDGREPTCEQIQGEVSFHDGKGTCVAMDTLRLYECEGGIAPMIERRSGTRPRRFLGPPYDSVVREIPRDADEVGQRGTMRLFAKPGDDLHLWVDDDGRLTRWLALPRKIDHPPRLVIVGDSIADGASVALSEAFPDWDVTIDAFPGRGTSEGVAIASGLAAQRPDVAVIELGTNDRSPASFAAAASQIMEAMRAVPLVVWQDVKGPDGVVMMDEVNAIIRRQVAPVPNAVVAHWSSFATDDLLSSDGVHASLERQGLMAELIGPLVQDWRQTVDHREACPAMMSSQQTSEDLVSR